MFAHSKVYEPRHEISNNVVCATSKGSDQPAHTRSLIRDIACLKYFTTVKILTEHHLEFLSLKGGCTCSSESTLVKIPHYWKSHVATHIGMFLPCRVPTFNGQKLLKVQHVGLQGILFTIASAMVIHVSWSLASENEKANYTSVTN